MLLTASVTCELITRSIQACYMGPQSINQHSHTERLPGCIGSACWVTIPTATP